MRSECTAASYTRRATAPPYNSQTNAVGRLSRLSKSSITREKTCFGCHIKAQYSATPLRFIDCSMLSIMSQVVCSNLFVLFAQIFAYIFEGNALESNQNNEYTFPNDARLGIFNSFI